MQKFIQKLIGSFSLIVVLYINNLSYGDAQDAAVGTSPTNQKRSLRIHGGTLDTIEASVEGLMLTPSARTDVGTYIGEAPIASETLFHTQQLPSLIELVHHFLNVKYWFVNPEIAIGKDEIITFDQIMPVYEALPMENIVELSIALPCFNRRAAEITNREEETLQPEQLGRILNLFQRSQKLENLELWVVGMAMNGADLTKLLRMLPKTIKSLAIFGYESINWGDEEGTHEEDTEFDRELMEIRNEQAILFDDLRQILQSFPKLEQINFERMLIKGAPLSMLSKEFRLANDAMIEELSKQGRIVKKFEFSIPPSEEPL